MFPGGCARFPKNVENVCSGNRFLSLTRSGHCWSTFSACSHSCHCNSSTSSSSTCESFPSFPLPWLLLLWSIIPALRWRTSLQQASICLFVPIAHQTLWTSDWCHKHAHCGRNDEILEVSSFFMRLSTNSACASCRILHFLHLPPQMECHSNSFLLLLFNLVAVGMNSISKFRLCLPLVGASSAQGCFCVNHGCLQECVS